MGQQAPLGCLVWLGIQQETLLQQLHTLSSSGLAFQLWGPESLWQHDGLHKSASVDFQVLLSLCLALSPPPGRLPISIQEWGFSCLFAHPTPPILWLPGELSFKLFSRALVAAGLKETGWLGLMSPPAGHPDPAASSSQSLSLTLTAAAVTPAAVSQDPESPGEETCPDRQHSACVAPVGSLLLDSPHTLPLRKRARDVEANPLLCCCPLGTFP